METSSDISVKRPLIIGVMGGGAASPKNYETAYQLGRLIAKQGWILLNGGRKAGVMDASAKGASEHGGLTIGILPDDNPAHVSDYIQIPVLTGMGGGRNYINVLSSDVVVACPGGAGTISEIALGLKIGKTVILLNFAVSDLFKPYVTRSELKNACTPEQAIEIIKQTKPYLHRYGS